MRPVDLEAAGYKDVIVLAKDQPQYSPLPVVEVEPGVLWSRWELSLAERGAILDGARVELWVWTFRQPMQPVMLRVEGVREDVDG